MARSYGSDMSLCQAARSRIGSPRGIPVVILDAFHSMRDIPTGSKLGLIVIGFGIVADLIAHLDPGLDDARGTMTGPQLSAHLVVFLGMVLVLAGVIVDGVRSNRRARGPVAQGRHLDALR